MVSKDSLTEGEEVFDSDSWSFTVVEVLEDSVASEYVVKEERKERGHVIYEEKTVADFNPEYPADDIVVKVERNDGKMLFWPISRIEQS